MEKKDYLLYSIPLIIIVGLYLFYYFTPLEMHTFPTIIGYISSLSSVIMVLVYLLTNSRQLEIMNKQLDEMQSSRNLQYQPLIILDDCEVQLQAPRYYSGPKTEFKKMELITRLFFRGSVANIGNSPAISIVFIPKISRITENEVLIKSIGRRVECLSLKEDVSEVISFPFLDYDNVIIEYLLERTHFTMESSILYKNALGQPFKQNIAYNIGLWEPGPDKLEQIEKGREFVKSSIKIIKTIEIDYGDKIEDYETLTKINKREEASEIIKELNEKIISKIGGDEINMFIDIVTGSFKVLAITESEYQNELLSYYETIIEYISDDAQ